MKSIIRRGVFETNSSSTHTLTLVSKQSYEADKKKSKPKFRNYGIIASKKDKLLMACGCCRELYVNEESIANYASWGDEDDIKRKADYDEIKTLIEQGYGDEAFMYTGNLYYEVAVSLIVRVYCELTGEDYETTYSFVDGKNHSGRACHMKFFSEGALDDAEWDYMLINDFFNHNNEKGALINIRDFFDDGNVLCYREYYGGIRPQDDDD